jgi:hypothetical protein
MSERRIKVLYITGWGRSGSTILGRVLGEIEHFFCAGELRYTWFVWAENRSCGCGTPLRDCSMWESVLLESLGQRDRLTEAEMRRLQSSGGAFLRKLPLSFLPGMRGHLRKAAVDYSIELERLYTAIQAETNCEVIVDTTKYPNYGHVLGQIPSVDLYVVHLVRHPCAVAYSWAKKKLLDPDRGLYFRQHSPLKCAVTWTVQNLAAEVFGRERPDKYMRIRYEDFIRRPSKAISSILTLLGSEAVGPTICEGNRVTLTVEHSVTGNPTRFRNGPVELGLDNEWEREMKKTDLALVRLVTWPLARRYGYSYGE